MRSRFFNFTSKKHLDKHSSYESVPPEFDSSDQDRQSVTISCKSKFLKMDRHGKPERMGKVQPQCVGYNLMQLCNRGPSKKGIRHEKKLVHYRRNTCCTVTFIMFILIFFYYSLLSTYVTKRVKNVKSGALTSTYNEMYKTNKRAKELEKIILNKNKCRRPRIKYHLQLLTNKIRKDLNFLFSTPKPHNRYFKVDSSKQLVPRFFSKNSKPKLKNTSPEEVPTNQPRKMPRKTYTIFTSRLSPDTRSTHQNVLKVNHFKKIIPSNPLLPVKPCIPVKLPITPRIQTTINQCNTPTDNDYIEDDIDDDDYIQIDDEPDDFSY